MISFPRSIPEFWRQFIGDADSAHPAMQFVKYGFWGGVSTVINMIGFALFAWYVFPCLTENDFAVKLLHLTPPACDESVRPLRFALANLTAFVPSNVFCWLLDRTFVFKRGRHHWLVELGLFFVGSTIAVVAGTALGSALVDWFGIETSLAYLANVVTAVLCNYILRKFFVFKG